MDYRLLGRTGLKVSCISLGTVELGIDYGIQKPEGSTRPAKNEAIHLLQYAADSGINLFDTAPGYGNSEELIGLAISSRSDCYIATKVSIPFSADKHTQATDLKKLIYSSMENSLQALRRDVLDIVQIHNATTEVMNQGDITEALLNARQCGKVRFLGVSVYGEESAMTAIKLGCFDVIQVAYNLLDQRMARNVFPLGQLSNIGIINRSALLKGVLTERARWLPNELMELRQMSEKIINTYDISWDSLPLLALRFCLSSEFIHTVLLGVSNKHELDTAIHAALEGPLNDEKLSMAMNFAMHDEILLNPSYWSIP
jgi:aryl-alcohol dehydrogenase-like predicted oxidoreductase